MDGENPRIVVLAGDEGNAIAFAATLNWAEPQRYLVSSISHLLWVLDEIESSQARMSIIFVPTLNPWLLHYIKNHAWWANVEFHSFDSLTIGSVKQVGELWLHG